MKHVLKRDCCPNAHLFINIIFFFSYFWIIFLLFSAVGTVLFGRRLGCLQDHMPQNIQDLINAVGVMFVTGHQMAVGANIHQFLNTSIWQKHVSASDIIYGFGKTLRFFTDHRQRCINPTHPSTFSLFFTHSTSFHSRFPNPHFPLSLSLCFLTGFLPLSPPSSFALFSPTLFLSLFPNPFLFLFTHLPLSIPYSLSLYFPHPFFSFYSPPTHFFCS